MEPKPIHILLVEDNPGDASLVRAELAEAGAGRFELTHVERLSEAERLLGEERFEAILLDLSLPDAHGLETVARALKIAPGVPVVVMTGSDDDRLAQDAVEAGAQDYLVKGQVQPNQQARAIRHAIERKRAEQQLKEYAGALEEANRAFEATNEKLRRANAELDEFTYVASHDLQEPLRKLVAFSNLLPRDIGHELPKQALTDLDFITDAARRMQTLVQDLLEFSRVGRTALKRERVSLDACADRAIQSLTARVEETGAEIARDELPEVVGDATLLTQLYQNLIGNALKFVAPDRSPAIRLTAEQEDGQWILGVRDTGIGIKPEYAQQIFSPFKRLHGRGEYEGTGIGLAICRKTVERHGGRIWIESEPGQGAHFKFTISSTVEAEQWEYEMENQASFSS